VTVFPGVSLTIEPGVKIQFDDSTYLEIRHGILNAIGNNTDSITFTSNSLNPHYGMWEGIGFRDSAILNINYCIFKYSTNAIKSVYIPYAPVTIIKNSSFYNNNICIATSPSFYCLVDNCYFKNNWECVQNRYKVINSVFENNTYGIQLYFTPYNTSIKNCIFCGNYIGCYNADTLINCNFSQNNEGLVCQFRYLKGNIFMNNDTALDCGIFSGDSMYNNSIYNNHIGILLSENYATTTVFNNKICHNTLYNLKYTYATNAVFFNNCWCINDSSAIAATIYDGYDNVSFGLINFMPFDSCNTAPVPDTSFCDGIINGINNAVVTIPSLLKIYPNPASDHLTLKFAQNTSKAEIKIYNLLGELKSTSIKSSSESSIDISDLSNGVYIIEVTTEKNIMRQKFIKQ